MAEQRTGTSHGLGPDFHRIAAVCAGIGVVRLALDHSLVDVLTALRFLVGAYVVVVIPAQWIRRRIEERLEHLDHLPRFGPAYDLGQLLLFPCVLIVFTHVAALPGVWPYIAAATAMLGGHILVLSGMLIRAQRRMTFSPGGENEEIHRREVA